MKSILTNLVIALVFTIPTLGQIDSTGIKIDTAGKSGMGTRAFPEVVPQPDFEATDQGIHVKVWVMSKMQDMDGNNLNTEVTNDAESSESTHHIMVEISDAQNWKEIADAKVKVLAVPPSDANSSVTDLKKMANHYVGNLKLDEKGTYELKINVEADGKSVLRPFAYYVK